jgi:hypothetical protein
MHDTITAGSGARRSYFKPPPRPVEELYKLPLNAWLIPQEAASVLGTTTGALSVRRSRGEWPPYFCIGHRMVRYRLADLLNPPSQAERRAQAGRA